MLPILCPREILRLLALQKSLKNWDKSYHKMYSSAMEKFLPNAVVSFEKKLCSVFLLLLLLLNTGWEFRISLIMTKRRKLTEEDISQLLDESEDEYKETDRSTLETSNDGEIDYISKKPDYEFSNDNILDEFCTLKNQWMNNIFLRTKRK